jgi:hypothetical protein
LPVDVMLTMVARDPILASLLLTEDATPTEVV